MTKIEKLKQQELAAAENLKAKEREKLAAQAAVTQAATAYDRESDDKMERAWLKAKEAEALAGLRLESAKRKLAEAEQERITAERAELTRRRDELAPKLTRGAIVAAGAALVRKEVAARRAVAELVVERRQLASNFRKLQSDLDVILCELGEPMLRSDESTGASSPIYVRDLLEAEIAQLASTDRDLADLLRGLLPNYY